MTEFDQLLILSQKNEKNQEMEEKAVGTVKRNPKYYYRYAKSIAKIKSPTGPLHSNGEPVGDPFEKSELLKDQYNTVFILLTVKI